ncbi:MAG TPA: methyltransferase domain-containing protein [Chloroflexota bacterium]|jgi:SAM-dependent methyltransferase
MAIERRESASARYVLGHSSEEQRRLEHQSGFLLPYTNRLLDGLDIRAGMRVLDVGCGTGEVSLLAAERVGSSGRVVGIDRSADVLKTARGTARQRQLEHIEFVQADLADPQRVAREVGQFDAVTGRCVIMHQPDPPAALSGLKQVVRPGGVIGFVELARTSANAAPPRPLLRRAVDHLWDVAAGVGMQADMGLRLHSAFVAAGLEPHDAWLEAVLAHDENAGYVHWLAATIRMLEPHGLQAGVPAADFEVDDLAEDLLTEAADLRGSVSGPLVGGCWARVA